MGFNNPAMPWSELEARLSDRHRDGRAPGSPAWNAGGDSPAWGRKRQPYAPPAGLDRAGSTVPYAELHCHSNFSFLDGASHPEQLAEEATRLGLQALALTDHDGLYGVVRFAEAARTVGLPTVFGAEISLTGRAGLAERFARSEDDTQLQQRTTDRQLHLPDPPGDHLLVLADGADGYRRLARALSLGHLAGDKGAPRFSLQDLAEQGRGLWWVLTGCRKGAVPAALLAEGPAAAGRELHRLIDAFGRDRVVVELWDHGDPLDSARNDALAELATRHDLTCVATNNVHYANPAQRRLATAMAAVRARRSLDDLDPWLPAAAGAHLRSGAEQAWRFRRHPGVIDAAVRLAADAAFDLRLVAPNLPPFDCPDGLDEMGYLRRLVEAGGLDKYGDRHARPDAWRVIDRELAIIEQLGYPGYFLVVWEIVDFCKRQDIYCQGRGSAANSAVCYALGVTNADAVRLKLLFERFLSPERDGPPDIDVDIESGRREEVIQHVFAKHGRHHAAQVANVITYRARSAVRDMARALGYSPGQQDAWSKQIDAWGTMATTAGEAGAHDVPATVIDLALEVEDMPRHLGIHSGGMVMCDRPVIEVCPVEWARMERRSVLQWDKDDCAAAGLVKFDLLGLGMLEALHHMIDLVNQHCGTTLDLAGIPGEDPAVYEMLSRADSVGVFQVESRAQMGTLPRLKPREFHDLVVEVALIRPGPIQGGSVHPYIRRRNGHEEVTYLHPLLENSLSRTLGVPLFQEQLMQMSIDVAGFTPSEADQLRQAMGSKRSRKRMEELRERLSTGMAANGITGAVADEIYMKMVAFADYGFPESHSVSFAYLVYASSWLKCHHPAAFLAGLLRSQPMGFWSPHSLAQDARRHGVVVRSPDLNASAATASLEPCATSAGDLAVRMGIGSVRSIGTELAVVIATGRPYTSVEDLVRRVPSLRLQQLETLATAGVFDECFGMDRRSALWAVGSANESRPDRLGGLTIASKAPHLPGMEPMEVAIADLWATGVAPDGHPTKFIREHLAGLGVTTAEGLHAAPGGSRVLIAGIVTHRQRPMTAQGTTFMNLEDETGLMNVVISKGCWARYRRTARGAAALLIGGRVESGEGVVNVVADAMTALPVPAHTPSRDFR